MLSCRARFQRILRPLIHARRIVRREYSNKVRAFPFAVSKEQAIPWLSCNTALYTGSNALETWIKYWLPFLDLQVLQPTRVQAAYLPTWIVDAELRGTVWTKKQEDDDHFNKDTAQLQFSHTDLAGYVFEPLSDLSFMTPELLAADVVPWSEDLRKHDGEDVLCVPYELTPLRIPEALRSLPMADGSISRLLRFEPPSVKEEFIAAYPVLIPVYLAQYNIKTPMDGKLTEMTITAFMEASRPVRLGRVGVETVPLFKQLLRTIGVPPPEIMIRGEHEELLTRFANVRSFLGQHVPVGHRAFVEKRINTVLSRNSRALCAYRDRYFGGAQEKAKGEVVDWSDPRIRPFDPAERQANLRWLKSNADLFFLTTMRDIYKARRENATSASGSSEAREGQPPTVPDSELEWVEKQITTAEAVREGLKPAWLAAYELEQRLLETPDAAVAATDGTESAAAGQALEASVDAQSTAPSASMSGAQPTSSGAHVEKPDGEERKPPQ